MMSIGEIVKSLDNICVVEEGDHPCPQDVINSVLTLIDQKIACVGQEDLDVYLNPSAHSRGMTLFFGSKNEYDSVSVKFEPSANCSWDYDDLPDALQLVRTLLVRTIETSAIDARRKELFRAEAARNIFNGSSRHVLVSNLPWVDRKSASDMLQGLNIPGMRSLSHRMGCAIRHAFHNYRSGSNLPPEKHTIIISPMICILDKQDIDAMDLMALIALDKEGE